MSLIAWVVVLFLILIIGGVIYAQFELSGMTAEERDDYVQSIQWGPRNSQLICPHCQTKGKVRVKPVERKKGVSGSKATAAVLTGGISLLGTGLSRKENLTQAHCCNCGSTWDF